MRIEEENSQRAVLAAISDDCMRKVLEATMVVGKSVDEISKEKSIPLSTCYRCVRALLSLKLLCVEHTTITDSGKKYATYRSILNNVEIRMSPDRLTVEVTFVPKVQREWGPERSLIYQPCTCCKRHPDYTDILPITQHTGGACSVCGSSERKIVELLQ